jgi:hypothetical protein
VGGKVRRHFAEGLDCEFWLQRFHDEVEVLLLEGTGARVDTLVDRETGNLKRAASSAANASTSVIVNRWCLSVHLSDASYPRFMHSNVASSIA